MSFRIGGEELVSVNCADCKFFTPPESQYERNSMGQCRIMSAWLDKYPERRPNPETYDRNYAKVGGKPFYPFTDRYCVKFEKSETPYEL